MTSDIKPFSAFSPQMTRFLFQGLEEIIGQAGLTALRNLTHLPVENTSEGLSSVDTAHLFAGLEDLYGERGGRGLALRAGRASFSYGLTAFGGITGVTETTFRLLPTPMRFRTGLKLLADTLNQSSGKHIHIEEAPHAYRWVVDFCPFCVGRKETSSTCSFWVGLLQEFSYWASSGKLYSVTETQCAAAGAAFCVVELSKKTLDG